MILIFLIFFCIILTLLIWFYYKKKISLINLNDSKKAKIIIKNLGNKGIYFIEKLTKKYPNDKGIQLLKKRFNPDTLEEGNPFEKEMTYTENKGEKIVMCLRNSDNLILHDENLIMYPFIHELSHLCEEDYNKNHSEVFKQYFKLLLKEAVDSGIYENIDLSKPIKYCNMYISN